MTTKVERDTNTSTQDAEMAVSAFEKLNPGAAFLSPCEDATAAEAALTGPAAAMLFPVGFSPMSANAIVVHDFLSEGWTRSDYGRLAAELHGQCVDSSPELAMLLRSAAVRKRVREFATDQARILARRPDELGDEAIVTYEIAVARSLVGRPEHEPHASIIAIDGPALRDRINVCRERHEAFALAEVARHDREALAVEAALHAAEQRRREELAAVFTRVSNHPFLIHGSVVSGAALAAAARRQGARDHDGEFVQFTLDELDLAAKDLR
jgi:hypothetical protein